jgi:hypothetical protein
MSVPNEFYVGYLPKAPPRLACFTRRMVAATALAALALGLGLAITLPYFGAGEFEFGHAREFAGTLRCEPAPRLVAAEADYLLVGAGKHRVPSEICGADASEVTMRGTLIRRDGRRAIEVESVRAPGVAAGPAPPAQSLGRFTLTGEIVDSKCYFGVMNPGEGRLHRACAEQCLRGGVPAVFVARDRAGATAHLLLAGPAGEPISAALLRWVGEPVEATGEVRRAGEWLVWQIDPATLRRAD